MNWIRRDFGLKVIAVLAAVVLWFTFNYLSSSQTYTKTLDVPLALHGVSGGLVAWTGTQEVTVELTGARSALEHLVPENFVAYVDCAGKRSGTFALAVSVVGPQTDKPVSVTPATAVVVLDQYAYRRVPVIADDPSGTTIAADIEPKTAIVAGGQTAVSRVFAAQANVGSASAARPVTMTVKAVPVDVHLAAVGGVTLAPASVRVTIAPRQTKG